MASLQPFTGVLGRKNARHLLRRASFVYKKDILDALQTMTPNQAMDYLFQSAPDAVEKPYDPMDFEQYTPVGWFTEDYPTGTGGGTSNRQKRYCEAWWWYNAINAPSIEYKLSFFLYTRFTVEKSIGPWSGHFYDYLRLLKHYAKGNFKEFAVKMTLNNHMLVFLDNNLNRKTSPNENYAREFFELFTIGKGPQVGDTDYTHFTEQDIVEGAKVLTGWRLNNDRTIIDPDTNLPTGYPVYSQHFNASDKVFSHRFDNMVIASATNEQGMLPELQAFVDMIFGKVQTARHFVRKLYQFFVKSYISEEVEQDIIIPLANQFISNGFEIEPITRTLLSSVHFYDLDDSNPNDETIGAIVKSPLQIMSEICTYFYADIPSPNDEPLMFYRQFWELFVNNIYCTATAMFIFDPGSVAGHSAYHQAPMYDKAWFAASTLIGRYRIGESFLDGLNRITNNTNIFAKINISEVIRDLNIVSQPFNPTMLTQELLNDIFGQEPPSERVSYYRDNFLLNGIQSYNWVEIWGDFLNTGDNSAVEPRLKDLLKNALRAPEFQLF